MLRTEQSYCTCAQAVTINVTHHAETRKLDPASLLCLTVVHNTLCFSIVFLQVSCIAFFNWPRLPLWHFYEYMAIYWLFKYRNYQEADTTTRRITPHSWSRTYKHQHTYTYCNPCQLDITTDSEGKEMDMRYESL